MSTDPIRASQGLFEKYEFELAYDNVGRKALARVAGLPERRVLDESSDRLAEELFADLTVEPIAIREERVELETPRSFDKDVRDRPGVYISDYGRPVMREFQHLTFHVPFDGTAELFNLNPNVLHTSRIHGEIQGQEIIFQYEQPTLNIPDAKATLDRDIAMVKQYAERTSRLASDRQHNILRQLVSAIDRRREGLIERERQLQESGIPVRRQDGAPVETYAVRLPRRGQQHKSVGQTPAGLDPSIARGDLEDILYFVQNLGRAIERTPTTFAELDEEQLRDHILLQLNGQYPAAATGETFSNLGKTDVHVVHNGAYIFIAECKFWNGPKAFAEAIDQLLRYTTWRDTKLALIIFNKTKNLTAVVAAADKTVREHAAFHSSQPPIGETSLRYLIKNPKDQNRLAFLAMEFCDLSQ